MGIDEEDSTDSRFNRLWQMPFFSSHLGVLGVLAFIFDPMD
jgi:hypothetical protein